MQIGNETSRENLPAVQGSQRGNLPEVYRPLDARAGALACRTHADALEQPTIHQLARHFATGAGLAEARTIIVREVAAITELGMEEFGPGRRMSVTQVVLFSEKIEEQYPHESLADINVFMRGVAAGEYDGGEYYANVDVPRLMKWWRVYLEQKADTLQRQSDRADDEAVDVVINGLAGVGVNTSDLAAALSVVEPFENRSKEDDRLRRFVPTMTDDQLRQKYVERKDAWARAIILREANARGLLMKAMEAAAKTPWNRSR